RLVYQFLKQSDKVADPKTVAAEIRSIGDGLKKQRKTWKEYLKENGYTQTTFQRQIEWRLSWQAYLAATINDKLMEEYFLSHLAEYDGSEVRASHILLRIDEGSSGEAVQRLVDKAHEIRKQIAAGELTFAEAAKKYSIGPSRLRGGDIGFFPRHGVQGEAFSKAAFELRENEVSDPVVTAFGVHLIQNTDIRAGKRKWTDVRARLRRDVTRELFEKIAQRQRATAKIEFTNVIPHFGG
ncbi:MAG: peptidylprolyl isomerase, partial [Pirellulales bacterium]|nr:peptidylprolyl isomerase [Pirellulales bacterium]